MSNPLKSTDKKSPLQRISITINNEVLSQLDEMVKTRGYANRSQAISEILKREVTNHNFETGEEIMAGSITLIYDNQKSNLQSKLANVQRKHINEVISSLHVLLENDHTMEVLIVQGSADKLRDIANELITTRGVLSGTLTLTTTIMPPIHQKSDV